MFPLRARLAHNPAATAIRKTKLISLLRKGECAYTSGHSWNLREIPVLIPCDIASWVVVKHFWIRPYDADSVGKPRSARYRLGRDMTTKPHVEFENERVRVTRVKRSGTGPVSTAERHDRLIIYLQDTEIERKQDGEVQTLERRTGEVVWRASSQHEVEVTKAGEHEVLIIELKP
jgi:hypothetical protein